MVARVLNPDHDLTRGAIQSQATHLIVLQLLQSLLLLSLVINVKNSVLFLAKSYKGSIDQSCSQKLTLWHGILRFWFLAATWLRWAMSHVADLPQLTKSLGYFWSGRGQIYMLCLVQAWFRLRSYRFQLSNQDSHSHLLPEKPIKTSDLPSIHPVINSS